MNTRRPRPLILLLGSLLLAACAGRSLPDEPAPSEAQRLLAAGQRALANEDFAIARGRLQDARALARGLDDTETQIRAVMGELEIALILEQTPTAIQRARTLDALARRDAVAGLTRAQTTYMLARVDAAQGRHALARQRIAHLTRRQDALGVMARLLDCREHLQLGPSDCAAQLYAREPFIHARIQRLRAAAAVQDGDLEQAMYWLESARDLYQRLGQRAGVAASLETLAGVATRSGDLARACDAMTRALGASLSIRNAAASRRLADGLLQHCADKADRRAVLGELRLALPESRPLRWHRAAAMLERYEATLHGTDPGEAQNR